MNRLDDNTNTQSLVVHNINFVRRFEKSMYVIDKVKQ